MRAKGFVVLGLLGLVGAGCGSDTSTTTNAVVAPSRDPGWGAKITSEYLLGTWSSGCVLDPKLSGIYISEFLTYDDTGVVSRFTTYYMDTRRAEQCTNDAALYQKNLTSNFKITDDGRYLEDRTGLAITPLSSAAVSLFTREGGMCGDRNWQIEKERDFTDVTICREEASVKLSLGGRREATDTALKVRECEPKNPRDCTELKYTR